MLISLLQPLGDPPPCIAVMGGGGKSLAVARIAEEAVRSYKRVLVSATAKSPFAPDVTLHLRKELPHSGIGGLFREGTPLYVMESRCDDWRWEGVAPERLERLASHADFTVFENDGARGLPLKQHDQHDPDVPPFATHCLIIVGADVIGTRVDGGKVHRPELFSERRRVPPETVITARFAAEALTSASGYQGKNPFRIPCRYFVNKGDAFPEAARELAQEIALRTDDPVAWGSLRERTMTRIGE